MPVACAPPHASTTSEPRLTWPRIACWLLAASFQSPTYVVSCLTFGLVRLAPARRVLWRAGRDLQVDDTLRRELLSSVEALVAPGIAAPAGEHERHTHLLRRRRRRAGACAGARVVAPVVAAARGEQHHQADGQEPNRGPSEPCPPHH